MARSPGPGWSTCRVLCRARLGGARPEPAWHPSDLADLSTTRMADYATMSARGPNLGRPPVLVGWGSGHWEPSSTRSRTRCWAWSAGSLAPGGRPAAPARRGRAAGGAGGRRRVVGLDRPQERLREWMPEITDDELSKMQELLAGAGSRGVPARERMIGVDIDPRRIRPHPGHRRRPRRRHPPPRPAERPGCWVRPSSTSPGPATSDWSWARSLPQVAGSVMGWLEERRPTMAADLPLPRARAKGSRTPSSPNWAARTPPGSAESGRFTPHDQHARIPPVFVPDSRQVCVKVEIRPCFTPWPDSRVPRARGVNPDRSRTDRRRSRFSAASGSLLYSRRPFGTPRRIRLEAQDTALSRRRSPVRIRYAVPPVGR